MRLRFSIRDLLWLTALVAMGIGWWLNWRRLVNVEQQFAALEKSASVVQLRKLEQELGIAKLDFHISETSNKRLMYELDRLREAAKK